MATEAILSIFLDKVAYLHIEEGRSLQGVRHQVQWIEREMRQIYSFLRDAREKEFADENVRVWIADIQETTYDVEDLIDTFILQKTQQRRRSCFMRYSLSYLEFLALQKITKKIERMQTNIRSISNRRLTYGIQNICRGKRSRVKIFNENIREQHRTSLHSQRKPIVGLTKNVKLLEDRLVLGDNLRRSVVSIVGKGGSGKTTLAQTIYNSAIIRRHFDCFVWIYVSQSFILEDLFHNIEKQLKKSNGEKMVSASEENAEEESPIHRKYLIVLDDVWTTYVWTRLEEMIPDSINGSRIVLTTRIREVDVHADEDPHEVQPLDEQDAWMLFRHFAFKGKKYFPTQLNELGRFIAGKCQGLPLAIVLMGGVLYTKNESIDAWSRVFDHVPGRPNQLHYSSILFLSYNHLPIYLKQCFLYFGIFPEGFEIPVKRLIQLWIAEGFVHPRGEEELEDVGKDHIEELVDRNIIQLTYKNENVNNIQSSEMDQKTKNGKPKGRRLTCSMHGLVQDLSISIAQENSFLEVYANESHDTSYTIAKAWVRRLAVYFDSEKSPSLNQNIMTMTL